MPRAAAGWSCTSRRPDGRQSHSMAADRCGPPPSRRTRFSPLPDNAVDYLDLIDAVQAVVDGVLFGATYALLGIGFTLVFGVMHKINLSYAAASIGAAYASLLVLAAFKAPAIVVFMIAAIAGGGIGALVYIIGFKFIPLANPLATLMSTVGLAASDRRDRRARHRGRAAELSGAVLRRDHSRGRVQHSRRPRVRVPARLPLHGGAVVPALPHESSGLRRARSRSIRWRRNCAASASRR